MGRNLDIQQRSTLPMMRMDHYNEPETINHNNDKGLRSKNQSRYHTREAGYSKKDGAAKSEKSEEGGTPTPGYRITKEGLTSKTRNLEENSRTSGAFTHYDED